jgi:hypothetical protein
MIAKVKIHSPLRIGESSSKPAEPADVPRQSAIWNFRFDFPDER